MHYCTFIIIGKRDDPESAVASALAPFDEGLDVPPYRDYLDATDIERMARYFHLSQRDLHALADKMEEWTCRKGGVDSSGLYVVSTWNKQGRWDWYEIGGRWHGFIPGSRDNVIGVRALSRSRHLRSCLPHYLLAPDGRWLEQEDAPWFRSPDTDDERRRVDRWFAAVQDVLATYAGHKVVCVDLHS